MSKSVFRLFVAIVLVSFLALFLPGCAKDAVYVTEPLPLPERPQLPTLEAEQLQCLSKDTYYLLTMRDILRRHYAEELETVIRSTHQKEAR